jgi:glycosyltransferase involved in cell wall biosynthesis
MKDSLILNCPINSMGYGITSYNTWKALHKKLDITLFPIHEIQPETHWNKDNIVSDVLNQKQYNTDSPCLKIWHPSDQIIKPHSKGLYATYSFFETDGLNPAEIVHYNVPDIVFVPTKWSKNILIEHNIPKNKIQVAPSGVDTNTFHPKISVDTSDKSDKYIFLNIGKWEIRKGHDILVHIFNQAFEEKDNVELWMLNHNGFISEAENKNWEAMYKNSRLGDKIKIFPRLPSQEHIAKLMKLSDCGIYPARAEGWNNEALETMAMNKPVILTNYSGHTQYATDKNSYLAHIDTLEEAIDGKFFHGVGRWASLTSKTIDQLVDHMRYVYKNNIRTNPNGLETATKFSWNHTASSIISSIYE